MIKNSQKKRKMILLIFCALLIFSCRPHLKMGSQTYDFGDIRRGGIVKGEFQISNPGWGFLKLEAKSGCRCLYVKESNLLILPQGQKKLHFELDTVEYDTFVEIVIMLVSNDPDLRDEILTVSGNVIR